MKPVPAILGLLVACGGSGAAVAPGGPDLIPGVDVTFGDAAAASADAAGEGEGEDTGDAADAADGTPACSVNPDPAAGAFDADCAGNSGCRIIDVPDHCGCTVCDGAKCVKAESAGCVAEADVPDAGSTDDATSEDGVGADEDATEDTAADSGADPATDTAGDTAGDTAADPAADDAPPFEPWEPDSVYCQDIQPNPIAIGQHCYDDCECETGLCYREAYTNGVGVCTKECVGEAGGTGCPDPNDKFKCVIFGTAHKDTYGLTIMSVCMPICYSQADCEAASDVLHYCPGDGKTMTTWEGITIAGQATCQVQPM